MNYSDRDYDYFVSAAGRVNIIGEHVDYCGGKVFPVALSLKNDIYIRANGTDRIELSFADITDKFFLDVTRLGDYRKVKYADYFAGCAFVLREAGKPVFGCDVLSDCKVPFGSGLSSSAAIEVSFITALLTIAGEKVDPVEVALLAKKAENEYVGMNCGIMDQYASACGKKGHAMLLDCATLLCEQVPITMGEYRLVVANTNKPHSLVESKYNERRRETEDALALIRKKHPVVHLAEVTPEMLSEVRSSLASPLYNRTKHVVEEVARVEKAAACMKRGDMPALGRLLRASHVSLRDLYEVTGRELDALADAANDFEGCLGSRMTGGGFGGSTVSVVHKDAIPEFTRFVTKRYMRSIGYAPTVYETEISDGITVHSL